MDEMLARAEAAVGDLLLRSAWAASTEECREMVARLQPMIDRLLVMQARHAHELEARGVAAHDGASSMTAWLRDRLHVSAGAARRLTRLGKVLDTRTALAEATEAGDVTVEQVHVIADALDDLPKDVDSQLAGRCEEALVEAARTLEPGVLRLAGERVLTLVAPEVAEEALARKLEHDEEAAYRRRGLTLAATGDGEVRLRGILDVEGAAVVRAALDPLSAPRPSGSDPDERTPPQRRADALVDICAAALTGLGSPAEPRHNDDPESVEVEIHFSREHSGTAGADVAGLGAPGGTVGADVVGLGAPGSRASVAAAPATLEVADVQAVARRTAANRPQICLTVAYDPLKRALGIGLLDTSEALSAAATRRLACDAAILPAICDGERQPLDLGRTRRLFNGPLRQALILRDGGCAFPSCDRPPTWSEGHHIEHWTDGGDTSLTNGVLLCRHHHRTIHHSRWEVRIAADGLPEFIPPAYVDPLQRPLRNRYHLRL